eukprot:4357852-Amphidinium_carterae.3
MLTHFNLILADAGQRAGMARVLDDVMGQPAAALQDNKNLNFGQTLARAGRQGSGLADSGKARQTGPAVLWTKHRSIDNVDQTVEAADQTRLMPNSCPNLRVDSQ